VDGTLSERARQGRKFGPAAEDYERGRPDWPRAAITRAANGLALPATATVVDLGAGTGKLTRVLAERFARVVAVEPLAPMRQQLAAGLPQIEVRDGMAERLPFGVGEVDAVFVAEAFHWFDGRAALAEVARVLRPAGGLALLWNLPAGPSEPPLPERARELIREAIIRGGEPGGPLLASGEWREAFRVSPFGELHHEQVDHESTRDHEGVVASAMSISSIAGLPAGEREALRARLRELIPEGHYRQPLRVDLHWTRLQPTVWCDRCGRPLADGGHDACAEARALEPPRFCARCRRRMKVQVLPAGWAATCAVHGDTRGP
jgi:SAM-dependent methyltransferase